MDFLIDYNSTIDGYISIINTSLDKGKVRITCKGNSQNFIIVCNSTKQYPLCFGNGNYTIEILKHIEGIRYTLVTSNNIEVLIHNPLAPFLYPNVYSDYTPYSECIIKSIELCKDQCKDIDKLKIIYDFIINYLEYDEELADKTKTENMSWWLPNPDITYNKKKGICWEYASLIAAMLRIQLIPTKIVIGYAGGTWHAWNEVYIKEDGNIDGVNIKANSWSRLDITLMSNRKSSDFINKDSNYKAQYYG